MASAPPIAAAALAMMLAGGVPCAAAQAAPDARAAGVVRGVVRSTSGGAVPYASVALTPRFSARFTDDSGGFAFAGVGRGTYRLVARQVGYRPRDTTVVVGAGESVTVTITLEQFAVELSEITVVGELASPVGPWRCTRPGAPDPVEAPELAAVFDQLRENAQRYWLLADSYPALYRMERRFGTVDRERGTLVTTWTDTVDLRTDTRWRYRPGRLLANVRAPRGGSELQVNLPTLPDFADTVFQQNHCFRLAGMDTLQGGTWVRLDFRAAERIVEPDADGSAYLDPGSYLIRFAKVHLTRPQRAATGLESFEATVTFREIVPSLMLPDRISNVQEVYQGSYLARFGEEQRTVEMTFLRPLPVRRE